jgi:hypothetical protein
MRMAKVIYAMGEQTPALAGHVLGRRSTTTAAVGTR